MLVGPSLPPTPLPSPLPPSLPPTDITRLAAQRARHITTERLLHLVELHLATDPLLSWKGKGENEKSEWGQPNEANEASLEDVRNTMKQNTMAHGKGCLPAEPDSWMILHVIGHLVVRRSE